MDSLLRYTSHVFRIFLSLIIVTSMMSCERNFFHHSIVEVEVNGINAEWNKNQGDNIHWYNENEPFAEINFGKTTLTNEHEMQVYLEIADFSGVGIYNTSYVDIWYYIDGQANRYTTDSTLFVVSENEGNQRLSGTFNLGVCKSRDLPAIDNCPDSLSFSEGVFENLRYCSFCGLQ